MTAFAGVAAIVALTPAPATAAGVGYVRLAHLSPDTPEVDVYLTPLSSGGSPQTFPGVGYGVVSDYLALPTGAYSVAMRLAGAPASDPPVLSTQVTVAAGKAYTVAGVGRHVDLGLRVIPDDLSLPPDGTAKVRIVQASVRAPVLSVSVSNGANIASGVPFAETTDYRLVAPGRWSLQVQPAAGGSATNLDCTLEAGNVYSLLVLDAPSGGLTAELRTDARRDGPVPQGGVDTGEGSGTYPIMWAAAGAALLAVAGARALSASRRRRKVWR